MSSLCSYGGQLRSYLQRQVFKGEDEEEEEEEEEDKELYMFFSWLWSIEATRTC